MNEQSTMYDLVLEAKQKNPHNGAIFYQGSRFSYIKFVKKIDRMADILTNVLDIKENDMVMVAQPNIPDTLILIYALNKIGAIVNLVHPFTPFNRVKEIIDKTNCKYAFLFEQRVAKEVDKYRDLASIIYVTRIEDYLPIFKKIFYHCFMNNKIRKKLGYYHGGFDGFKYLHSLKPTKKGSPTVRGDLKKTSVLLHSGSTTGDPKTICLSDNGFNHIASQVCDFSNSTYKQLKGTYFITALPSFHGFGFCMTMHTPICGRCGMYLIPKFSTKEVNKALKKKKISVIVGVPTMYETLLKDPKFNNNKGLKHVRACFSGGDSMSITLEDRFNDVLSKNKSIAKIYEGYGLTESIAANCCNRASHYKKGSLGYPIKDVTFKILDEDDKEVPLGKIGEICINSPANMLEYFKDEVSTKKTLKNGYVHTGDYGYMDKDGFIFFSQRIKRVVKVSGVGVFPTEIEKLVQTIPGVEQVCAIQIPDPRLNHAIKLFVVGKYFDKEGFKETIMDTCRKYLIRWSVPKEIEFIDELPMTLLGKVDFKKLQEMEDKKRGLL